VIRPARQSDLARITAVRTSVIENHLSVEQLAERGITEDSIWADIAAGHLGAWVGEAEGRVVAFAMADRRRGQIFALFTEPGFEGRGLGAALLVACEDWLVQQGWVQAHLDSASDSRAAAFYLRRGWEAVAEDAGDTYFRKQLSRQQ